MPPRERDSRRPGPCNARGCESPFTRLYPCGWRCEEHKPGAPAVKMIPHRGDTAEAKKIRAAFRELTGETA